MIIHWSWVVMFFIVVVILKVSLNLIINEYYVNQITRNWTHNVKLVHDYGMALHRISCNDCAPCEVKFEFRLDGRVVFDLYGKKSKKLLRKMERLEPIHKDVRKSLKREMFYDNIGLSIKNIFEKIVLR